VEIYSYNDHVRLLSPEPVGWLSHHQLYSGVGADIVMESITLIDFKGPLPYRPIPLRYPSGENFSLVVLFLSESGLSPCENSSSSLF